LNVKLVLIPDKEDPDSYVNKVGASAFNEFVRSNRKDFILFQLEVALKDAGTDTTKKSEVVNSIAETISKINKAEDFTKQQDYIQQCSEILKIDEAGLHALVNKFIRNRISTQEKVLPFDEAKLQEENAQKAAATDYEDSTFNLLFKDELQEKEFARVLLEHGNKKWNGGTIADHMLNEILDETLFDNVQVLQLINEYRKTLEKERITPDKNLFIYSSDPAVSSFVVSLLNFPYEASEHWKKEFSSSTGYQQKLFDQSYEDFLRSVTVGNEAELMTFLKMDEDKTHIEVESALSYLKLKKIKRMLLENQVDLEKKHTPEEYQDLAQTHEHLKQMEREISDKLGAVIIK